MSDNENDLRTRVDAFVNELSALIRRQALEAVEEVLKKGAEPVAAPAAPVAPLAPRKRGRPTKAAVAARAKAQAKPAPAPTPAPAPAQRPVATPKRKAGEKRTPQQLAQITEQTYNYIKSNGNQGVEQIAKALGTSTKELTLPIRKLLADKKIGSKGQKRATRYFPVR